MSIPDVLVVGGGIIGQSVAWHCARRGLHVTLLERGTPGAEASVAAAGILGAQAEAEHAGPLLELSVRSRAQWPGFVTALREQTGVEIAVRKCGILHVAFDDVEAGGLAQRAEIQRGLGLRAEVCDRARAREIAPALSGEAIAALWMEDDGQVDNQLVMRVLAAACERSGVRVLPGRQVTRILTDGRRVTGVECGSEVLTAAKVVVAAGAWTSILADVGLPARAIRPVRGQIVEATLPAPIFSPVLFGGGGYVVPRQDGRVLCGSTMEEAHFVKAVTVGGLRHVTTAAARLVPRLEGAAVTATWSGFRPMTDDALPVLGKTRYEGLLLASGHCRNGILLAPATGEAIAALAADTVPAVDLTPFSAERLRAYIAT